MTTNGRHGAATDEARRLVARNYADEAVASLGDHRVITNTLIHRLIGVFDPNNVSLKDLDRMREDPMIRMGLEYSKSPLITADYSYDCEDPQIKAAAIEADEAVHVEWMNTGLTMFDFGFQAAVKDWALGELRGTYEDGKGGHPKKIWADEDIKPVVIKPPISLPPFMVEVALDKGRFDGIKTPLQGGQTGNTRSSGDREPNHIPADWSLWFVNRFEDTFGSWYGRARIHSAYKAWWSFWFNWLNRDRHAEMDADPALQVWYPPGEHQYNGQPRSNKDAALEMGQRLRGGGTIAWPSTVYHDDSGRPSSVRLWDAAFLTGGENLGAFNDLLNDLRVEKLRAGLVPEQALIEALGGTGSRNAAATYISIFLEQLEKTAIYLDAIWNKYQLRPFIEANFGKDAPPCTRRTMGFGQEDLSLITQLITVAFQLDPNALPINFERLLEMAKIPQLSKKEQDERAKQLQTQQGQQPPSDPNAPGQMPGEPDPNAAVAAVPDVANQPTPEQLAASQDHLRTGPRKYEIETIHLASSRGVQRTAPAWAHREGRRRDGNVAALAERLQPVVRSWYDDAFKLAAQVVAESDDELQLGVGDKVRALVSRIANAITGRLGAYTDSITGEMAGVYHTAGMAELTRLGLAADSWDVGRDEVQEWARGRAGELVTTMSQTVVNRELRPWLTRRLEAADVQDDRGVPMNAMQLSAEMSDHFKGYPQWMSERVIRTEAMRGYNLSAADMWERVGVSEVEEYDGLGGRTGQTDEHCLERNGRRVTLDEFRQDVEEEHPNGTLGAVPVTVDVALRPLAPGLVQEGALMSASMYAVTSDGLILSEAEVGRALAEA